jgi:glycosyltransferase involved in cell wall biosynthesis
VGRSERILYCSFDRIPSPKGASTHITHFTEALSSLYASTTLLTLTGDSRGADASYHGARHLSLSLSTPNFLDRVTLFRKHLERHLHENRYHIVQFRSIWEGLPVSRLKRRHGYKTIFEVNALPSIELPYHYPALRKKPEFLGKLRTQELFSLHNADLVITPSGVTARFLARLGVSPRRVEIIPNGVQIHGDPGNGPAWDKRPLRLLYMGTLAPWQGVDILFRAIPRLRKDAACRVLLLASGKRRWFKRLEKLARKLKISDEVVFLEPRPHAEVTSAIRSSHICVAPLRATRRNLMQGCCPIKILEYLAHRKPVVASDIPAVRELAASGGEALLVKPDSPLRLRNGILKLIRDPALGRRLAEAGYRKVLSRFPWRAARERLLLCYERLLGNT